MKSDIQDIRNQFPFFKNNPGIIYLDSASTSQKPQLVIDEILDFYSRQNANAGRSIYNHSIAVEKRVQTVRSLVSDFINGTAGKTLFTSGFSDAQSKIANSFKAVLESGAEILYSPLDHQSFVEPWFRLQEECRQRGVIINLVPYQIKETGEAHIEDILHKVNERTKVINITHIHNVFGCESDIDRLRSVRDSGVIINVDATQSVGHTKVDVQKMGADILSFSGHKMFGSFGVGVTWVSGRVISLIKNQTGLSGLFGFESGTYDYAGISALGRAVDFLNTIGNERISNYLAEITQYTLTKLKQVAGISFTPGPFYWACKCGYGIIAFNYKNIPPLDIAQYLGEQGIYVRAGEHCSFSHNSLINSVRVSLHIYNTKGEIDRFCQVLSEITPN